MSSRERAEQLLTTLQDLPEGTKLVILLSGHPDPDSIGSALAHQRLARKLGLSVDVAHVLPLSRPENRALVKLLQVEMQQISHRSDLDPYDYYCLVDCHSSEVTIELPEKLKLLSIVDHHRSLNVISAPFQDIRPNLGATATIYAEYFEAGIFPLDPEDVDDQRVATALLFGIETDTDDFVRSTSADLRAAAYLKTRYDQNLHHRFGHRLLAPESMAAIGTAISELQVVRDFAVAGVGRISLNNRDAIASAADFLLRREDIDTVLVYGLVDDRIDGSLRTSSPSVDPAKFLLSAFGKDPSGRPYGGGRADKGGFQIPLGFLAEATDSDELWQLAQQVVFQRVRKVVPELALFEEGKK